MPRRREAGAASIEKFSGCGRWGRGVGSARYARPAWRASPLMTHTVPLCSGHPLRLTPVRRTSPCSILLDHVQLHQRGQRRHRRLVEKRRRMRRTPNCLRTRPSNWMAVSESPPSSKRPSSTPMDEKPSASAHIRADVGLELAPGAREGRRQRGPLMGRTHGTCRGPRVGFHVEVERDQARASPPRSAAKRRAGAAPRRRARARRQHPHRRRDADAFR